MDITSNIGLLIDLLSIVLKRKTLYMEEILVDLFLTQQQTHTMEEKIITMILMLVLMLETHMMILITMENTITITITPLITQAIIQNKLISEDTMEIVIMQITVVR